MTVVGNPQNVVVSPGDTVFVFLMTVTSPVECHGHAIKVTL